MKVVSGKFNSRRLLENKYKHIRPTADKVRQAIFNKLQFFVQWKSVLDLFCGTGALGIEAISQGAEQVVFVDKDARSVSMTKSNLKSLNIEAKVFKMDAKLFLERCQEKFDLILLDPPYKSGLYEIVLKKIEKKGLLADDGIIVCEHAKEDAFDYQGFSVFDEKRYGTIMVTYLEK